ncbi:MAG: hypothetical protein KAJ48_05505, partial [Elusimicrobiales bacterium]|nr:hypothetical protein [Elusimicrobiales bacterium]
LTVRKGLAENGEMVRVDVFEKNKKYYLIPIYVWQFTKKELPNRAISANQPEEQWPVMDESYNFKFSLYKDDLISVNSCGEPEDEKMGYFLSCHRGTGALKIISTDRTKCWNNKNELSGIGARTLKSFKKYQVDLLGKHYEVKKEKRVGIIKKNVMANNNGVKSGQAVS